MNGRIDDREQVAKALVGLSVNVLAGQLLGDTLNRPLTYEGGLAVVDWLKEKGFKVVSDHA